MYRFVILHHQSLSESHWDVMLETDAVLMTWSIPPQSPLGASFVCPANPLPPHRKDYLDYEGEITGNRGSVTKIDAGTYEQLSLDTFLLKGTIFMGKLTLDSMASFNASV